MVVNIFFNIDGDIIKELLYAFKGSVEKGSKDECNPIFDKMVSEVLFVHKDIDDPSGVGLKVINGLKGIDVNFVGELVRYTESGLLMSANLGRKSLLAIKNQLAKHGLTLGMPLQGWNPPSQIK